jgi:hypothetical protein
MAGTITIRTDAETEHALAVLTADGTSRSAAIRRAVLDAAVLQTPLGEPDGINIADELSHARDADR